MTEVETVLAAWRAFAARVTLTFPFRVDVLVEIDSRPPPHGDRVSVGVELHVLDRDTREPITVRTRSHVGPLLSDDAGIGFIFDLLATALRHETYESVRLDGNLQRDQHARPVP